MQIWLAEITSNKWRHYSDILACGELWSAQLLSAVLNGYVCPSYSLDAREFLQLSHDSKVEYSQSSEKFRLLKQANKLVVVTGYIAKDSSAITCTLGRNGSDYSATIMAVIAHANKVTLWTDVDGIYSADPRIVPNSRKLHRLSNQVAKELGRLGNPILHAKTLNPLSTHKTPLHVASSFSPETVGTEIGEFGSIAQQELAVTHLNDLLLVTSTSLQGEQGIKAQLLFSPICADQHNGFIVIDPSQQKSVSHWLASQGKEVVFKPVAIIATVGYQVASRGDVRARFTRALKSSLPLHVVTQDGEGHSIIAVVSDDCTTELINNVHYEVTKSARQIGLVVAGLGNIGQRFLKLLPAQLNRIKALENLHLVGLVDSTKALINTDGIDTLQAQQLFAEQAQDYDHHQLLTWLGHHPYDELIVVDITPSEAFSNLYCSFFEQGIHIVGANKIAASSTTENYNLLKNTATSNNCIWLGNATVGAGLPVNFAIQNLLDSGDSIEEISGIFSGTLSWLFENYGSKEGEDETFSHLLTNALGQGITEPDPRDDLSGRDVQRKLLILARIAGFTLSLDDIDCQNLIPEHLQKLTKMEFLARSDELNEFFATKLAQAKQQASCIRYVARFTAKGNKFSAKVSLETLKNDHAFSNLTPCDNIFQIKTQWYQQNPLIIRGPGAGRDVTAGGIHSDLVSICQRLALKNTQVKIKGII